MASALMTGIFGAVLTYWLGAHFFGFGGLATLGVVGASNVAGFISLLLTLALERRKVISRTLMGNAFKAWIVLFIFYTGLLCLLSPALRSATTLAILFLPLVCSTGFMLPLWGPSQDWVIRLEYRIKRRSAQKSANQQFSRPKRDVIRVES